MSWNEFRPVYLSLEDRDGIPVVRFNVPRLTEDVNLEQIGHELFALVDQYGCRKIIVSMQGVEYSSSSGIGKVISLHRRLGRVNDKGILVVCELEPTLVDILRTAKLHTYFNLCETADQAVEKMKQMTGE